MNGILIINWTWHVAKYIPAVCFSFVLNKNASKAISEAEYALNPERLNIDRGALGSECHARSGLGGFSDFPTQRHGCCCSSLDFPPLVQEPRLPNIPNRCLVVKNPQNTISNSLSIKHLRDSANSGFRRGQLC